MKKSFLPLAIPALLLLSACSDPSFTVEGTINYAEGKALLLETSDHAGFWIPIDSTRLSAKGNFSFSHAAPVAPEIYRLNLDGQYIYFPVDSIETVSISASAPTFASGFTLAGSPEASSMEQFEKELLAAIPNFSNPDSAAAFKRRVYTQYLQDARGSVVSYYILTKTIADKPLFSDPSDARYLAAVATSFRQYRPNDPRTAMLEQSATAARRANRSAQGKQTVLEAEEISFIPITLPDESATDIPLSEIAGHGTPTLLVFSDLSDPATPAFNMELKKLVEAGGVKIYNVGVDADQLQWRTSARNLPWTTVYASPAEARRLAASYNVSALPTIFVLDPQGTLKARCTTPTEAKSHL